MFDETIPLLDAKDAEDITTRTPEMLEGDINPEDIIRAKNGINLLKQRTVKFNHAYATKVLEMQPFTKERPLRDEHVAYLIRAMHSNRFRPEFVNLASTILQTDHKEYRMNGQHTAWAVLGMPEDFSINVRFLDYHCKTMEDMAVLYSSFDRGAARTTAHVVGALLLSNSKLPNMRPQVGSILNAGFGLWMWETAKDRQRHTADDRAILLTGEHLDVTKAVVDFLHDMSYTPDIKHLFRGPVVAAMFATFSKNRAESTQFWRAIRDGSDMQAGDVRLKLRNLLMRTSLVGSGTRKGHVGISGSEGMYRACLYTWNATRTGRQLQAIRTSTSGPRPKVM